MSDYQSPSVRSLGSVASVTEQTGSLAGMNKVGLQNDQVTQITGLIGQVVPPQP